MSSFLFDRALRHAAAQTERFEAFIKEHEGEYENALVAFYTQPNEAHTAYLIAVQLKLVREGKTSADAS